MAAKKKAAKKKAKKAVKKKAAKKAKKKIEYRKKYGQAFNNICKYCRAAKPVEELFCPTCQRALA